MKTMGPRKIGSLSNIHQRYSHIENALIEMARLVAALARQKHTNLPAKHTSENVYVLFESDPKP